MRIFRQLKPKYCNSNKMYSQFFFLHGTVINSDLTIITRSKGIEFEMCYLIGR